MKILTLLLLYLSFLSAHEIKEPPLRKIIIIGGGIIGAFEAYNAYLTSVNTNTPIQILVYDKNGPFEEGSENNTAYHICPSLTPDEILSVVPRGKEFIEKLALLFNQPGGIRVNDVARANTSASALRFQKAVQAYGQDPFHQDREQVLLQLGKKSMELWHALFLEGDEELKALLNKANFHPCFASDDPPSSLNNGYRIDLIYDVKEAMPKALRMQEVYQALGYRYCQLLSPKEVIKIDPSLTSFCLAHSEYAPEKKEASWKSDAAALWRPGGSLSTADFLPLFYAYLKAKHPDFSFHFSKEVIGVEFDKNFSLTGIRFQDGSIFEADPSFSEYVFCPGESVGTLSRLGFEEPSFASFAGASLTLEIPLSPDEQINYQNLNHAMELHKEGIVLAWQARFKDGRLILQGGGTKAFYGEEKPQLQEAFAIDRHLTQLNIMNEILPEALSIALKRPTQGCFLSFEDLQELETTGILKRWVGRRAVAYDGFLTLGPLYTEGNRVKNGRCTTHLGSGGVSFAPAAVEISRHSDEFLDPFSEKILRYSDSRR